jgi:hypothetical protein
MCAFMSLETFPHLRTHPQFAQNGRRAQRRAASRALFPHLREHAAFSPDDAETETAVFGAG